MLEPIRPNLQTIQPQFDEPSIAEHLYLLACGRRKSDGTVDREAFSKAMEKNEWLQSKWIEACASEEGKKRDIQSACDMAEKFPELQHGKSWILSKQPG